MTIFQKLINLDKAIMTSTVEPIIVNRLSVNTEKELGEVFNKVTTQYYSDKISMLPQCQCTPGSYISARFIGEICPSCNTVVQSSIENDIQSVLWFQCPKDYIVSLMSPIAVALLRERFTKQGWDIINWLTDTTYKPAVKVTPFMSKIIERFGDQRGWNNFCLNFDDIMGFLFTIREFQVKKGEIDYLQYLLKKNRSDFFCNYLPLPNKAMFVFENTNMGVYRDTPTAKALQFITLMMSIERSVQPLSQKAKENRVSKLFMKMTDYLKEHIRVKLSPKEGEIRRNILATKNILSFRTVVTSITKPYQYDSIAVPWIVGLTTFRLHLLNKLMRYGFTHNKAVDLILSSIGSWNPLLDRFLNELKEEAPGGKISTSIQRNPSQLQGSLQLCSFGEFKRDPGDKTTGIPLPICRSMNLDFDGDEINFTTAIDGKMTNFYETFSPYYNVREMDKPYKAGGNIYISKPIVGALASYLSCETE